MPSAVMSSCEQHAPTTAVAGGGGRSSWLMEFEEHERGTEGTKEHKRQMFPSIESVIRSPKNSLSRARSSTDSNMNKFLPAKVCTNSNE